MLEKCRNSNLQGNIGLGQAIAYFTAQQFIVNLPLNDSQKYDLIVDADGKLYRVSVKTTDYLRNGNYIVALSTNYKDKKKPFDNKECDYIFIQCGDGSKYLIESTMVVNATQLTLNAQYGEFKL